MSRYTTARMKNKRPSTGGGNRGVWKMDFTPGKSNRIVLPSFDFGDGDKGLYILGETTHGLVRDFLFKSSKSGSRYSIYNIRCMNIFSQPNIEKQKEMAENHCVCPMCQINTWEERRQRKVMSERYPDNAFSDLTKDEQKAFYQEMERLNKVRPSHRRKKVKDEEGNEYSENILTNSLYVVGLEIETEQQTVTRNGKERVMEVPVINPETGVVKYKVVFIPFSQTRLDNIESAVDTAITNEIIDEETHIFPIIENEGTDMEHHINYAFVDLTFAFPAGDKQTSGKNLTISVIPTNNSVVTEGLRTEIADKQEEIFKQAMDSFKKMHPEYLDLSFEDYFTYMNEDSIAYYNDLKSAYEVTEDNRPEPYEDNNGKITPYLTDQERLDLMYQSVTTDKSYTELRDELYAKLLGTEVDSEEVTETEPKVAPKVVKKAVSTVVAEDE